MPYPARFAQLYNWLVHGQSEPEAADELTFLVRVFAEVAGRPVRDVLDVGCGQGRILVPLLRQGYQVTGIDISPGMLEACRLRLEREGLEAPIREGGMETLEADAAYDAILGIDSVICYLRESDAIVETLRRFHRALRPGGVLVLDNWNALGNWRLLGVPQRYQFEEESFRIELEERCRFDTYSSLWDIEFRAVISKGGGVEEFHHVETLRVMTVPELQDYLRQAGFAAVHSYTDYSDERREGDPEQIQFVARRGPRE